MTQALAGIRIIDLTACCRVPACTRIACRWGAGSSDRAAGGGDYANRLGLPADAADQIAPLYGIVNRGKAGGTTRSQIGRHARRLLALVARNDALVEGSRRA